jgi:phosphoglycolate phosphatase-like HAD superfamily hydrolase
MTNHTPPCQGAIARAVLFDVDGTLVDNNDLHVEAWHQAFLHFGHPITPDRIRPQVGKGADNLLPALLPDLDEAARKEIEDWRLDLFKRDYLPRATPFPGVRPLFERLVEEGVRIVLASSSNAAEVRYHIGLIGCEDLIHASTSRDDVEHSKPCPDIFEAALAKVAPVGADEASVVGDTPWDMKAAAQIGLRAIGFRSGGFADTDLAGACAIYDGARDLLDRFAESPFARHAETV